MMNMIPETIARAVCWTLLHSLWQGLIVAVIAGTVMVLTKRSSSSLRYKLLCSLLFLFLAMSGYTFYRQLSGPAATNGTITTRVASEVVNQPQQPAAQPLIAEPAGRLFRNGIDNLVQYFNTHAALVVLIWFIVFLARFVQLLSGLVYTQRIRHYKTSPAPAEWQDRLRELVDKLRITRPVLLLESALIKIPVVVGFLKPVILVPAGMLAHISPDQVESILLHELAHIRRQDYLLNLIQNLVSTLYFFNPAMIWISSLIRTERENCCDDIAIRETRSRRLLIEALVSFREYEQNAAGYALSFAKKESQVVRRVKRIVYKTNHSLNVTERILLMSGLLILSAAFVTITPIASKKPAPVATAKPASVATPKPVLVATHDTIPKTPTQPDLFKNISVDKLIEARDHGVTPEYISSLRALGYRNFSLDKAIELVDHGVTAEYIMSLRSLGFEKIPLDKAIELVDHGVTAEYIAGMKKRMGKLFELNDYIKLADAGISPTSLEQQ